MNDGSHQYFYDAENHLIQVGGTLGNCSTATACYTYDALGQRVSKTSGGVSLAYLYDTEGHVVVETNLNTSPATWTRGEIFAAGRHIATYSGGTSGTTNFIETDWLGTERVRTNHSGTVCETITSLLFGDGQSTSGFCGDVSPLHFTGKERDTETGLDNFGARFNATTLGRFMSADPENAGADNEDPQSWNAYAYVMNNPLNTVDPDGRADCVDQNPFTCTVTATTDWEPVTSFSWRVLWQNVGDFARKTNDYLHAAYKAVVNSRAACTAAYTAAGAVAGASVGAEAGATVGTGVGALGFAGGPTGLVTTPAGAGLGGLIGGAAGGFGGGALGYNTGLAVCSSGTGNGGGSTEHDQAQSGDPNRQVGDPNRVIREGRKFTDSDTGYTVHVSGDRVVITDPKAGDKIVTRFVNSRANTQARIESGKWIPQ